MIRRYAFLLIGLIALAVLIRMSAGGDVAADSGLRAFVVPIATLYLNTFNSASTAITLCLLMLGAGAGLFFYFWQFRIAPALRDLRDVSAQLRAIPDRGTIAARDRVERIMSRHAIVARGWTLYRGRLGGGADGRVVAAAPPERYFDMRMLEQAGVRLRFFLGLPNDFVGIGLVFTFMGLVAGLYFASRSMMSADLNVARDALVQLLHAATFKFLTSITGIGLSLVLGWSQRFLVDGLRSELAEIQFLLEERFPVGSVESGAASVRPADVSAPAQALERPAPRPEVRAVQA